MWLSVSLSLLWGKIAPSFPLPKWQLCLCLLPRHLPALASLQSLCRCCERGLCLACLKEHSPTGLGKPSKAKECVLKFNKLVVKNKIKTANKLMGDRVNWTVTEHALWQGAWGCLSTSAKLCWLQRSALMHPGRSRPNSYVPDYLL